MALSYPPLTFPVSVEELRALFDGVEHDASRLLEGLDDATFNRAPAPGEWSAALCLDHLAVITRVYVGAMERGVDAKAARRGGAPVQPGWPSRWFIRELEPPVRRRFKAPAKSVPEVVTAPVDTMWRKFVVANDVYRTFAGRCADIDTNRMRFPNPFAPLRFTIGTGLAVMVAHHRRHVAQMDRALERVRG